MEQVFWAEHIILSLVYVLSGTFALHALPFAP